MTERSDGALVHASTSARIDARDLARVWLVPAALGAAGFALNALVKLPVQLPGHNALFWISALALGRLASPNPLGGTAAGVGAIVCGVLFDPLEGAEVAAAGIVLDVALAFTLVPRVIWIPVAGVVADLAVLGAKLVAGDVPNAVFTRGLDVTVASYAVFGALSAAIAGLVASLPRPTRPTGARGQR